MSHLDQLLTLTHRALATSGPCGINVVPVSALTIEEGTIILHDFFMGKTVENIRMNPMVALTAWEGAEGIQIKGVAHYETSGATFVAAVVAMATTFPERTLRGIIRIQPEGAYIVSPGPDAGTPIV